MALHSGITSTRFQTNTGGSMEDLPKGMAQAPEQVAEATLASLMPRKSAVSMMGRMMEKGAT